MQGVGSSVLFVHCPYHGSLQIDHKHIKLPHRFVQGAQRCGINVAL